MNENVTVCITPKGEKPVLHFSQFDNERVFTVTVLADDGESAAVLTGLDIEFRIRKTDSHVVTIAPESVADNVITFKTTEQLCACCGQNIATVTLMKDDMVISTLDILVDIQRDILSGGLTSESDIRNLTTQIEQIVPEVVGDDYYNKQEVDDLLAEHTFDPTNYYDKSDVDGLLADKADSDDVYTKSDVYNKTETDNLLADKANISDVYAKTEVNNLLSAKMDTIGYHGIVDDAAVISFTTDCNAPLDIIKGKITPVQSGSGTPSPQNVRPISGFNALNVTRTGVNLFRKGTTTSSNGVTFTVNNDGSISLSGTATNTAFFIAFADMEIPNGTYTLSGGYSALIAIYIRGSSSGSNILGSTGSPSSGVINTGVITGLIRIQSGTNTDGITLKPQLEFGNQATDFKTYSGETYNIPFEQTVYGGSLNVTTGELTVTKIARVFDGSENFLTLASGRVFAYDFGVNVVDSFNNNNSLCSHFHEGYGAWDLLGVGEYLVGGGRYGGVNPNMTLADYKTYLQAQYNNGTPVIIVATLATPTEITTTPETVLSIAGDNNIFLDTGNLTEIAYFEGAEDNLIKLIKACQI